MGENLQIWLYPLWLCFEKCPIMAIFTMATFFKILAIMDLQFMAKKKTYAPKGDTQYLTRGPFVFTYVLFGVSKSLEHFKNLKGFSIVFFASKCFI